MKDYRSMAVALYDGGWRSWDKEELVNEYGLDHEESTQICEILDEMYNNDKDLPE